MSKSKVNFVIDALMFLCMMWIVGIGLLMKLVLVPGKERWVKYGRGVDLSLLGMDRHQWGTIHLIMGLVLLGLLALHVLLHWKAILSVYQRLIDNRKTRRTIAFAFIIVCLFWTILLFIVKPEVQEIERGKGRGGHVYIPKVLNAIDSHFATTEVFHFMLYIDFC